MTAVASPPSFSNITNRTAWSNGGQSLNSMNPDDVRGMFMPRKSIQRTNSSSSLSSNSSTSSTSTLVSSNGSTNGASVSGDPNGQWPGSTPRKRPQPKSQWSVGRVDGQSDFARMPPNRAQMANGLNGASSLHQQSSFLPSQGPMNGQSVIVRPMGEGPPAPQPVLYLLSLNGTFERKTISVPFLPETLRIGRQTNAKTVPTPINGYFDSKVLSRQHAEIWADRSGKIWIRDIKSSNGTFVNGTRLSAENRESEPHELQTSDHLELGIDIVSEDQKSVVHHKVAAKVEHAGFISPSSNLLDMNFGDLDPSGNGMGGPQMGGMQMRGRTASQSSIGANGRLPLTSNMNAQANGMALARSLWLNGPSTEAIVKKLHQEMRNARQQSQDLQRTQQFLNALLSKDDIKNEQRADVAEPPPKPHMVNGNGLSFRADPKTRFSDPPAPPPQQPLPEKPDVVRPHATEIPSLKRATTERAKPHGSNVSPVRPDNSSQIFQLTEALNNAKRELDLQHSRMRDLEEMLLKEQEARKSAEELARKLEDAAAAAATPATAAISPPSSHTNGVPKPQNEEDTILEETFEPPVEANHSPEPNVPLVEAAKTLPQQAESAEASAALLHTRIEGMMAEMTGLKQQLEEYKRRAETAEADRDADRETLAEMVKKIRQREEEDARRAAAKARSLSRGRKGAAEPSPLPGKQVAPDADGTSEASGPGESTEAAVEEQPALSRANTITPSHGELTKSPPNQVLIQSIPYASMLGVVLLGMGLMAYINGWQPQPRLDR